MRKLDIKEILVPALSLFLICAAVAGALALVNSVTAESIAAGALREADDARQVMFPGSAFEDRGNCFIAKKDGAPIGYCVDSEAQGYGGLIKISVGLDLRGTIVAVQVIACDGETPGLGQKVKEESFLGQFTGGKDAVTVDSITGATISSRAVEQAINEALRIYREVAS